MTQEIATLEADAGTLTAEVRALVITDAASFARAAELARGIATYIKRVGEVFDPITAAADRAHKTAVAQRDALLKPARALKELLGTGMARHEQEQARLRREAEAAARRERERLEREAREAAERKQAELRKEAEDWALADAAAAEARGDHEAAERIIAQPVVAPIVVPAPVFAPAPPPPAPPRAGGVSFRDSWKARVTDLPALVRAVAAGHQPITLLEPNMPALNGLARSLRQGMRVPGVEAENDRTMSTKAS